MVEARSVNVKNTTTINTKPLHGIETGSPMVVTLGQQYNIGEKPTVILYTYINRHGGTPERQRKYIYSSLSLYI